MEELVILHYEEVLPKNWHLFKHAAKQRDIRLITWQPHKVHIYCKDKIYYPLYDGKKIIPKFILHRTVFRFGGIILPALEYWGKSGTKIVNTPANAFRSRDKLLTTLALIDAGIPIVPTIGFVRADNNTFIPIDKNKIIIKPAYGTRGQGIKLFKSSTAAKTILSGKSIEKNFLPLDYYVTQPFVDTGGVDIRAFVVDGVCIALMQRKAKKGDFRANIANDATAIPLPLDHPAAKIAIAAMAACKLDYGGVDMIIGEDEVIRVLEVDAWAGFAGITEITGIDVAGAIIDLVLTYAKGETK